MLHKRSQFIQFIHTVMYQYTVVKDTSHSKQILVQDHLL
jgi:hypothetical protein